MKVLIVSAPTGGHLYPAVAVARELAAMGHESVVVTRGNSAFVDLIRREVQGFPVRCVGIGGAPLPRRNPLALPLAAASIASAVAECVRLIVRERPRVIVGTGGYTTVPMLAAARLFPWIPVVLHEQNRTLGVANRIGALGARRVCLGFPIPNKRPPKYVVTGNPVRPSFTGTYERAAARRSFGLNPELTTLLVFGGSQGARALNTAIVEALSGPCRPLAARLQVLHIAGNADAERVSAAYRRLPVHGKVVPYCDRMHLAYAAADCAVCRAGAMTVTELLCTRTPAILVPYPHAAGLHQHFNAAYLANAGCARIVYQSPGWERRLAGHIADVVNDPQVLYTMRRAGETVERPTRSLASAVVECV